MERIFDLWETSAAMARDIGESPVTVRHWKRRGSIPAKYDAAIVDAAKLRGKVLTFESLARLRAGKEEGTAA